MKVELTPAYLLHHRDYRETSLLLDVFSREYGRIDLIAKGAKRPAKKNHTHYDLYQKYTLSWIARSELGTLTNIESIGDINRLDTEQMMTGFYMNELIVRLLHKHEPHPGLFDAYENTLKRLMKHESGNIILRYFERTLLNSTGYGMVLDHDVETGEAIRSDKDYFYQFDHGPFLSSAVLKPTAGMKVSGKTLLQINSESIQEGQSANEAKALLKSIFSRYLGDKPLASRELYQSYIQHKKAVSYNC